MSRAPLYQPVKLAEHGTSDRAPVCTDDCPKCGPIRDRARALDKAYLALQREASHENKAERRRAMPPREHGHGSWGAGCRCGVCRKWRREYMRPKWRDASRRRREKNRAAA